MGANKEIECEVYVLSVKQEFMCFIVLVREGRERVVCINWRWKRVYIFDSFLSWGVG